MLVLTHASALNLAGAASIKGASLDGKLLDLRPNLPFLPTKGCKV